MVEGIVVAVAASESYARFGEWAVVVDHALGYIHCALVDHTAHNGFHILEACGAAQFGKLHTVA